MIYCTNCGRALSENVNFCTKCGAEVTKEEELLSCESSEEFVVDDEPEVEDCDEEPEKGPPTDCYATFQGRRVTIYRENGSLYRYISLNYEVLNAQISGDKVSITCVGGRFYIYTLDGVPVRSGRY